jgi:hypothetical protein
MNIAKTQRNLRIWMEKDGLESEDAVKPTKTPVTFRKLSFEYDLSVPRLLLIVNRERKKHGRLV